MVELREDIIDELFRNKYNLPEEIRITIETKTKEEFKKAIKTEIEESQKKTKTFEIGEKIEDCYVLSKISRGGMGAEVFKALQVVVDKGDVEKLLTGLSKIVEIETEIFEVRKYEETLGGEEEYKDKVRSLRLYCEYLKSLKSKEKPISNSGDLKKISDELKIQSATKLIAIKFLSNKTIDDKLLYEKLNLVPSFENEIMLQSQTHHENIVSLHKVFGISKELRKIDEIIKTWSDKKLSKETRELRDEVNKTLDLSFRPYRGLGIVIDYIDGKTIKDILDDRTRKDLGIEITPDLAFSISFQIASALQHIHESNMIYDDLGSSNTMLTYHGGLVKLFDFGVAKEYDPNEPGEIRTLPATSYYMSPQKWECTEVVVKRRGYARELKDPIKLDHRNDIYALGAMIYELLIESPPFPGELPEVKKSALSREPVRPGFYNNKLKIPISPLEDRVVLKCLKMKEEERYQSAGEVMDDISMCLKARGINLSEVKKRVHDFMSYAREEREKYFKRYELPELDLEKAVEEEYEPAI